MKETDSMRKRLAMLRLNGLDHVALVEVEECLDAIERELEEGYVELPKDKNDIPIHIGDVLQGERFSGGWCNPFKVIRMRIDEDGWEVYELGNGHIPNLCRHKPPTVEDVLREMLVQAVGYSDANTTVALNAITEYAPKLQLRERDDG